MGIVNTKIDSGEAKRGGDYLERLFGDHYLAGLIEHTFVIHNDRGIMVGAPKGAKRVFYNVADPATLGFPKIQSLSMCTIDGLVTIQLMY